MNMCMEKICKHICECTVCICTYIPYTDLNVNRKIFKDKKVKMDPGKLLDSPTFMIIHI